MTGKSNPQPDSIEAVRTVKAHAQAAHAGVLLVNLGTPEAPTAQAVRPYLKQFLSDPRVIEAPKSLWRFILHGYILPFRSPQSAKAYARIWTDNGSPLLVHSQALADRLETALRIDLPRVKVMLAMSYGKPDMDAAIERIRSENIQRLLVVPLYPQYSATTTASVFDRLAHSMKKLRWLPEMRFINCYHHEASWQTSIAESIKQFRQQHGSADKLLFSFHGIPKRNLLAGDPYYCQCQSSARSIAEYLGLDESAWMVSFQSRLGRAEWLKPYTDKTLAMLGRSGVKRLQVVCPGFSIDCLETLDEIAIEGREIFRKAGGESLQYIPCLNESDAHVQLLDALCRQHGQGWPEFAGGRDAGQSALSERIQRAGTAAEQLGLD